MIAQESINKIKEEVDLAKLGELIIPDLKKEGASFKAPCPFPDHAENTPSFVINPAKQVYKCFGCGKGGSNPISLVMAVKQLDFVSALRYLASEFKIELVEVEQSEEQKQEQVKRSDYLQINRQVADIFLKNFKALPVDGPVISELTQKRKLTADTIAKYEIGFALNEFKQITPYLVDRNAYTAGTELGLIKTKEGSSNTYDAYRNRIIFPIHNEFGDVIGFGGRKMDSPDDDDYAKKAPKYLNSSDSAVYKKERVLYGLYQAAEHIRKMKFAVLVEGYYDVCSFAQTGLPNTVAGCGTAWTEGHAKILKRFTNHVMIIGDGDSAGMKANLKAANVFLTEGFKVDIVPLPEGHDPDSFARLFDYTEQEEAA
jgi:DNA primase